MADEMLRTSFQEILTCLRIHCAVYETYFQEILTYLIVTGTSNEYVIP